MNGSAEYLHQRLFGLKAVVRAHTHTRQIALCEPLKWLVISVRGVCVFQVEMHKCFRPGDVIVARVVSLPAN